MPFNQWPVNQWPGHVLGLDRPAVKVLLDAAGIGRKYAEALPPSLERGLQRMEQHRQGRWAA